MNDTGWLQRKLARQKQPQDGVPLEPDPLARTAHAEALPPPPPASTEPEDTAPADDWSVVVSAGTEHRQGRLEDETLADDTGGEHGSPLQPG